MSRHCLALLLGSLALLGCQPDHVPEPPSLPPAPAVPPPPRATAVEGQLLEGMGKHHRKITTDSPMAQRFFDQGLTWAYSFNYDEARRSFRSALAHDPRCVMAWWGIALVNGPHINNPSMTAQNYAEAWEAIQKAKSLAERAAPVERDLVNALATRYSPAPPADRRPLDEAYASAMAAVYRAWPADTDVGVLYAEAMMDLQPWDLWTKQGKAKGQAERIVAVLEEVLGRDANHPGGVHYYIHAVEASENPHRAMDAADRLRQLVPAAGHMVHMPSHIDARTGRWASASKANEDAIDADRRYRAIRPRIGFWHVYMAHNRHFLAWSSMVEGRREVATRAAREMVAGVPEEWARQNAALVDGLMPIVTDVLIRFGRWDEILSEPAPPSYLPIATAMWHYARATAFNAKGQKEQAVSEQAAFEASAARVPSEAMMAVNPARHVLGIASHVLRGEIAYRRGDIETAVMELRRGAALEDELRYMEPPEWLQPVRHALGAVLVAADRHAEAEKVYTEDLARWPENGWALFGLAQCQRKLGKAEEAEKTEKRFGAAWVRADTKLEATCMCVK